MRATLAFITFSFLLFNSSLVFAAESEGDSDHNHTTSTTTNESNQTQVHEEGSDAELTQQEEESKVETNESEHSEHRTEEESHSTDEATHGTEGGHGSEEITESAPNYLVLSVFGVVNLTFILVGIWNKMFRKRGNKNVFAK